MTDREKLMSILNAYVRMIGSHGQDPQQVWDAIEQAIEEVNDEGEKKTKPKKPK